MTAVDVHGGGAVRRRWTVAWLGGALLGVLNGVAREKLYADRTGERMAQQISTASLAGLLAAYFEMLDRRWPIATRTDALVIGGTWSALTVGFEFLFGRYVDGKPWSELLAAYDIREGRLWPLVPAGMTVGPEAVRLLRSRHGESRPV